VKQLVGTMRAIEPDVVAAERHQSLFRRAKMEVVGQDTDWRPVLARLH